MNKFLLWIFENRFKTLMWEKLLQDVEVGEIKMALPCLGKEEILHYLIYPAFCALPEIGMAGWAGDDFKKMPRKQLIVFIEEILKGIVPQKGSKRRGTHNSSPQQQFFPCPICGYIDPEGRNIECPNCN
jgi:hypothetical protein